MAGAAAVGWFLPFEWPEKNTESERAGGGEMAQ